MKKKVITFGFDEQDWFGVTAISLVDMPAIESDFVALRGEQIKLSADEERRMLYGAALIPDKQILRVSDTGEEYYIVFPKETIVKASQLFFKKNQHHNHTLMHEYAVNGCTVVESWIKESDEDKSSALGLDVPIGTWLIGVKVDDDGIWQEVKAGTFKGFSIEGMFARIDEQEVNMRAIEDDVLKELEQLLLSVAG